MSTNTGSENLDSVDKLKNAEGYPIWKFQVGIILKASNLYDTVVTLPAPDQRTEQWKKNDAKAQKIIVTTIDKQPIVHILSCESSFEMWHILKNIYERDSEQQKCALMQRFFEIKKPKSVDVTTHVAELKNLAYRLKALGENITDDMVISKILTTLPDKYKFFASAWESVTKQDRTLPNLTARLLAEESRNNAETEEDQMAFKTEERKCFKCGKKGHLSRSCKSGNENGTVSKNMKCYACKKPGHSAKDCRSKVRTACGICKKTNHKEKDCFFRKNSNENREESNQVSFLTGEAESKEWIIDSGTTSHMTNDKKKLSSMRKLHTEVGVANKKGSMEASGKGKVKFENCILKDVLYVPDLRKNLLSVSAITDKGGKVLFEKDRVLVTKKGEVILKGKKDNLGLYVVKPQEKALQEAHATERQGEAETWHKRLGHLSAENMKKLQSLAEGMSLNKTDLQEILQRCGVCKQAKQTRTPFGEHRKRAKRPLEIIHSDVCGPISPSTWDNKRYFITFLDDYTNYTMIYLMEAKSEALEKFQEYTALVETKWNKKVANLRCDNGKEYTNKDLQGWCRKKGININYTAPYTPQLNGKAERLNRTLVEKVRAIIFNQENNKQFWGEAVRVAAFLHNRSPTKVNSETAYQMWNGEKPNLKPLKIFGCKAYTKEKSQLKKLDKRSSCYKFVGYTQNAYRLWDPENRKIKISRDVIFDETTDEEGAKLKGILTTDDEEQEEDDCEEEDEQETEDEREQQEEYTESEQEKNSEPEVESTEEPEKIKETPKRTTRKTKLPRRFTDYVMLTYEEAINGRDKKRWKKAIEEEKFSLKINKTWELIDRNDVKDIKILTSKWVFRVKEEGKYKARLVVRGCEQKGELDYEEIYSPVINSAPLRMIFALAAVKDYYIVKFDIKTAFLYGEIQEEIYMRLPEGFQEEQGKICKLKKALYGLKQAPKKWNKKFTNSLKKQGLEQLSTESCLFKNEDATMLLAIYIDDGLIVGSDKKKIKQLVEKLKKDFEMKEQENPQTYLGMELTKLKGRLKLSQKNYIEQILDTYGMENAKPVNTPILPEGETKEEAVQQVIPYQQAIGSLLYLTMKTRPDLCYAVSYSSRYTQSPKNKDYLNVKRILRYLQGTKELGLVYGENTDTEKLVAYCDADYAGDPETRKSTTGYVIQYCGGPVSWCSRKQPIVALSTTEAEFIAAAECCKEVLYLKAVLEELRSETITAEMQVDNQSAIHLIKTGVLNRRSKHMDVRFRFIQEKIAENNIVVKYCSTENQTGDIFTKPLNFVKFAKHRKTLIG